MSESECIVRRADRGDGGPVADLWEAFLKEQTTRDGRFQVAEDARERFENDFPIWLADDTQRTVVAEQAGGALVGFATAHRWGPPPIYADASEVFIDEFFVAPAVRRQGIGRRLADALRAWAAELEADRLRLRVLHGSQAGRAFWQDVGGVPYAMTMTIELDREEQEKDEGEKQRFGF